MARKVSELSRNGPLGLIELHCGTVYLFIYFFFGGGGGLGIFIMACTYQELKLQESGIPEAELPKPP